MRIRSRHLGLAICVAVAVHVIAALAMVLEPEKKGAAATGRGGIEVSLGPSGGAPGSVARVVPEIDRADPVDQAAAPVAKPDMAPPEKAETREPTPETATPTAPLPPAPAEAPVEAPVETAEVVRPVDEVIAIAETETLENVERPEPIPEPTTEPIPEPVTVERVEPVEVARVQPEAAPVETALIETPPIEAPPLPVTRPAPPKPEDTRTEPAPVAQRTAAVTADTPSEDEGPSAPSRSSGSDGRSGVGASALAGSAASSSGGGQPGVSTDYVSILQAWLEEHKEYPRRARSRRQEGVVYLYFVMDRGGRVLQHRIDRSSGYSLLDREVEAMIRRAEPLPAMPDDMTQARLELVVPVQFRLR